MRTIWNGTQLAIAAPAKINLFLEVRDRRADGYHELETVMSSVSLFDWLRFSANNEGDDIQLSLKLAQRGSQPGESDPIPAGPENLVCRALALVRDTARAEGTWREGPGITVEMIKQIPSAAGLGGASSNAAAALVAGNRLWGLGWNLKKLASLAGQLGSDITFFLTGGTAVCRGRGEQVTPLAGPCGLHLVIAKPPSSLATGKVFSKASFDSRPRTADETIESWQQGRWNQLGQRLFNRLTPAAVSISPAIESLKQQFEQLACLGHLMSGSGSSYFGLFPTYRTAIGAQHKLAARNPDHRVFVARTLGSQPRQHVTAPLDQRRR